MCESEEEGGEEGLPPKKSKHNAKPTGKIGNAKMHGLLRQTNEIRAEAIMPPPLWTLEMTSTKHPPSMTEEQSDLPSSPLLPCCEHDTQYNTGSAAGCGKGLRLFLLFLLPRHWFPPHLSIRASTSASRWGTVLLSSIKSASSHARGSVELGRLVR